MKKSLFYSSIFFLFFYLNAFVGQAQASVEIYTMDGCGRCEYAIDYVKKNKVKYVEYSTENDEYNNKMWEVLSKSKDFKGGNITMPVIVKGGIPYFNIKNLEDFMAGISKNPTPNSNQNQNQNVKKTGCISGNCVNGIGVFIFANKDKYEGSFINSKFSGFGKYTWANGGVYEGAWQEGKQKGYGTYTDANGGVQQGNWLGTTLLKENNTNANNNNNNTNNSNQNLTKAQIKEFVDVHNAYRAEVNVGPLTWSNELALYAKAWGDHLAQIGCEMEHRPRSGEWTQKYGENLYWCSGYAATPKKAVDSWGEEKPDYDGGVMNDKNFVAGHYTQMIWAKTTQVGCAIIQCSDGAYIVVCNYNPAGNYWGQSPLKK